VAQIAFVVGSYRINAQKQTQLRVHVTLLHLAQSSAPIADVPGISWAVRGIAANDRSIGFMEGALDQIATSVGFGHHRAQRVGVQVGNRCLSGRRRYQRPAKHQRAKRDRGWHQVPGTPAIPLPRRDPIVAVIDGLMGRQFPELVVLHVLLLGA